MTPQILIGLLLLLVAAFYTVVGLHLQRDLATTTARLRNSIVRQQWIERDMPQCRVYLIVSYCLSGVLELCGLVILIKQF